MDIASLSTGLAQMKVADSVGAAMYKNVKEMVEQQGDDIVKMMESAALEQSVTPNKGGNIDIRL